MRRDVVERLYAGPPDGFVAARKQAAEQARSAGDAEAAREIAKLRKPTVAAWLVNLLAIRRPELVDNLVELSAALRAAQRELRGPRLRELSGQRRGVVSALVTEALDLARAADPSLARAKLPVAEVEATLHAALADAEVAEQVRSGRMVRAATYAGFGEVPRPQLRLVTGGEPDAAGRWRAATETERRGRAEAKPSAHDRAAVERAEADRTHKAEQAALAARRRALDKELLNKELSVARTAQKRAAAELEQAVTAERNAADALAEIDAALRQLQDRRIAAEEEVSRRKLARKTAERAAAAARRRTGEVQAAVEAFESGTGRQP